MEAMDPTLYKQKSIVPKVFQFAAYLSASYLPDFHQVADVCAIIWLDLIIAWSNI